MWVTMGLLHLIYFLAVGMQATWGFAPRKALFHNNNLGITGGHKVSIKDIPFMVSINEIDSEEEHEYAVICAGTIIHERFILTSASCFIDEDKSKKKEILLGTQNLMKDGINIDVEGKFCHEDYDAENLFNDICLLKLESEVPFGWLIKAVLPSKDYELQAGTGVNVTGWGATRSYLDMEVELLQVTVAVVTQEKCDDLYEGFNDDQICAGGRRHDFCKGDNGGPLTIGNMQVGVISGSGECGKGPGVYTRITSYLDWIHSTINNNL